MKRLKTSFPKNLLDKINFNAEYMTDDTIPTLYYLLCQIDPDHVDMVILFYKFNETYGSISAKYNLSRERVRQIISTITEKLAKEYYLEVLKTGIKKYYENKVTKAEEIVEMRRCNDRSVKIELTKNEWLDSLNISSRTYFALKRAGINTISDVLAYGRDELIKIEGFGLKGYQEIVDVLVKKYGEDPYDWKYVKYPIVNKTQIINMEQALRQQLSNMTEQIICQVKDIISEKP